MGEQVNIDFTTESKLGNDVFLHTVEPCGKANSVVLDTQDATVTTSGMQATISTSDGNEVGVHDLDFSINIGSNGLPKKTSVSVEITPACRYSPISSSQTYEPISVFASSANTLPIDLDKYTHEL